LEYNRQLKSKAWYTVESKQYITTNTQNIRHKHVVLERFEDTYRVIRSHNSQKDRQYNSQKNDLLKTT
jgi:hypothetical protein